LLEQRRDCARFEHDRPGNVSGCTRARPEGVGVWRAPEDQLAYSTVPSVVLGSAAVELCAMQ
jgi:hypothetical protein